MSHAEGIYELLVSTAPEICGRRRWSIPKRLKTELEYFVECIQRNQTPINDGKAGWRVVQMLEAANQSLKNRGAMVELRQLEAVAA